MEPLFFEVNLLVVLFLSGICVRSSLAFPPEHFTQHASFQKPQLTGSQSSKHTAQQHLKVLAGEREKVNTVSVTCHPDLLEIVIKADMFEVGAPVNGDELRLGVEYNEFCRATASSGDEYRIVVGLLDCGTKHWMTDDSLVYTNLLIFSPEMSPDGVIRMDEAVIPIECHYERRYSLSSSSLTPTWIPFMSTQAAVETLEFDLRIMTNDWLYERGSNVFYLGEPIGIEASVRIGHHMGLRVFISSCVATLYPDIYSNPRYDFIENGCLVDSQLPGSKSHFLPRTQDDKLHLVIDAFRFHNEDKGELYITCHLNAVPVNDAEAQNQACTLVNGRWRSADGNDYLCGYCQGQNEVGQTHSKPSSSGKFAPRGFGKSNEAETSWRGGLNTNKVWEQEARVGPVLVLPTKKSGPLPVEDLPPVLHKISRPTLYGSQWKSGISPRTDLEKGLLPGPPSTSDQVEDLTVASEQKKDGSHVDLGKSRTDPKEGDSDNTVTTPEVTLKSKAALDTNTTAAPSDLSPTMQFKVDVTTLSNATAAESDLSDTNDPKR
ncbi:zona pellucida sperm-binding protein 3-like [Thunnus thynnus]|uniref:zona pellucida sperm-binding protein 3-like n=1 Tax=Thunnus thynnus TaxID=8237 RepID=UPI0035293419